MSEWNDLAAEWDESSAARAYAAKAFESLTSLAEATGVNLHGCSACDFGCGTGLLTERLADVCGRIDAIDTSPAMLRVLRRRSTITVGDTCDCWTSPHPTPRPTT